MNPDVVHDLQAGNCVRTVYITAGDAGSGQFYWLGREEGSEAAYSEMLGADNIWAQRSVKLADNQFITVAALKNHPKVSLIFMHLPDGNLEGQGFRASHNQSLAQLEAGRIKQINSVDNQSAYTSPQLITALASLMFAYTPTEIRTQANFESTQYPDHSDHQSVGRYVEHAYTQYENEQYDGKITIPLKFYIGYPVHAMANNVFGADLAQKEAAFLAYAKFDNGVCQTLAKCNDTPTYSAYLRRQYQSSH